MQRIDTLNARESLFGPGKAGFHDNVDLPGQDATYLCPEWLNAVQEELCNLLELNGINLNPESKRQLYDLLSTQADLEALASEIEKNFIRKNQYASTATKGIIQLASESEVLAGSDSAKAVTPETLKKSFQGSLSRTGWRKLVDGSIEQWGVTPLIAGHQSLEVTLPVTFAKAGFNVIVSAAFITGASTSGLQSFYAEFINNSKIIIFHDNVDATYAQSCYWRVIGE